MTDEAFYPIVIVIAIVLAVTITLIICYVPYKTTRVWTSVFQITGFAEREIGLYSLMWGGPPIFQLPSYFLIELRDNESGEDITVYRYDWKNKGPQALFDLKQDDEEIHVKVTERVTIAGYRKYTFSEV